MWIFVFMFAGASVGALLDKRERAALREEINKRREADLEKDRDALEAGASPEAVAELRKNRERAPYALD